MEHYVIMLEEQSPNLARRFGKGDGSYSNIFILFKRFYNLNERSQYLWLTKSAKFE